MRSLVVAAAALALVGCASPAREAASSAPGSGDQPQQIVSVPGKPIHTGLPTEPGALGGKFASRAGQTEYGWLFGAELIRTDYQGNPTPLLVQELPSLETGTWRVLDDGRMETTYRLRPSAVWHDGTPLTADDAVFTWRAIMNPDLPATDRTPERSIEHMEAVDRHTLLVRWRETYVLANAYPLEPLPRHILEPILQRDPQSFVNASYWSRDWVGLGPYRLADWVPGSYLRGHAFAEFVLGAPRIEEVYVHFIPDANQAVARFLAGALDLTVGSLIRVEEGAVLKEQLEARGEGTVVMAPEGGIKVFDFQFREPLTPMARDARLRRAMYHALDRQLSIDTLQFGFAQVAHTLVAPSDAAFARAEATITKYPYDVNRAAQLFAEAGWTRGPDGILRTASGERLETQVRVTDAPLNNKEGQVIADFWKSVGVNAEVDIMPRALQNDQEYRAKFPGVASSSPMGPDLITRYRGENIPSDANRWRGSNRGGYSHPEVERLSAEYFARLDPGDRIGTHLQLLRFLSDELPVLATYYQMDVYGTRTGLKGVTPASPGQGWQVANAHLLYWEK
jgi:peptide/nickel transport system substrate-binding protein